MLKRKLGLTSVAVVALSVALAQPIVSDDEGRWPQIWADNATYFDVVWSDLATDANIKAYSDVRALDNNLSASADVATAAAAAAVAAAAAAAVVVVI